MNVRRILGNIMCELIDSDYFAWVAWLIRYVGVTKIAHCIYDYEFRKNNKKELEACKNYFRGNIKGIKNVINLLADDKSIKTYENILKYKATHERKYLRTKIISKNQYFPRDIISLSTNEVFVDGGGYTGDTMKVFFSKVGICKKYFAFEPETKNFEKLKKRSAQFQNVKIYKIGLGSCECNLSFQACEKSSSRLVENGNEIIKVNALDNIIDCKVTYIKMDIEGAEYEAILGARRLIEKYNPKLAISIYHLKEDYIRIPLLIHELVPEYKLYIRHHSDLDYDTVLYAVI